MNWPQRKEHTYDNDEIDSYKSGWNACLDQCTKVREDEKIKFACGCFLLPGVALSCCPDHDYPNANIGHFSLCLDICQCELNVYQKENFKEGYHGQCPNCDKPVIIVGTRKDGRDG